MELHYQEVIGLHVLLYGSFEETEVDYVCSYAHPRSTAIDVGANVGLFTIELAAAVGPDGQVIALEPAPSNLKRLNRNLDLNGATNVDVLPLAAAAKEGMTVLQLSNDPAFHSTTNIPDGRSLHQTVTIPTTSLDLLWERKGSPAVSVLKIDVEGGEQSVLLGASNLLRTCRPVILVEIQEEARMKQIESLLRSYGYVSQQPAGFMPWNYLFIANSEPGPS